MRIEKKWAVKSAPNKLSDNQMKHVVAGTYLPECCRCSVYVHYIDHTSGSSEVFCGPYGGTCGSAIDSWKDQMYRLCGDDIEDIDIMNCSSYNG